jgi:hypothetical protein
MRISGELEEVPIKLREPAVFYGAVKQPLHCEVHTHLVLLCFPPAENGFAERHD